MAPSGRPPAARTGRTERVTMEWLKLIQRAPVTRQPDFRTGDDVRVWFKILEQGKERLGQFEGVVIRFRGSGVSKTFTVRRVTHGVGVERVFPVDAPVIERIEVLRHGKTRRGRLYFLRSVVKTTRLASVEQRGGAAAEGQTAGSESAPAAGDTSSLPADIEAVADKPEVVAAEKPVGGGKPKS
jgi:large subunit ribosomal protein L19